MNPHAHPPTSAREASDLSRWPATQPLGPEARHRREVMLGDLRGELRALRIRRAALRGGAVGLAVVIALLAGARVLRPPTQRPPIAAESRPIPAVPPAARPLIATIETDPSAVDRLAASTGGPSLIRYLDDEGLVPLLQRLGEPGLIKIDGRVMLSRDDAPQPPPSPQSAASTGPGAA